MLQAYGTMSLKSALWNKEFGGGKWDGLESTPNDCIYPYIVKYSNVGSILDLGCGSGSTGNELDVNVYRRYLGVDISDVALEKARERTSANRRADNTHYCQSDIFSYVPTEKYDVILFRDSIYYIRPRRKIAAMLTRYSRYLNEGGVFIVRMYDISGKYRSIVDIIEDNFDVVEKRLFDDTQAFVIVFRQRRIANRHAPARR
jgi:predicted TPR repeat methyltransferase